MFNKLIPLNKFTHAKTRVKPIENFAFAKPFHIASIMVHEFGRAASVYPIVFLEDKDQDVFKPVAMLGLEAGENLFVDESGMWKASYVPAIIRRYPFALARNPEQPEQLSVCIDEESPVVSTEEGQALFDESGEPTKVVENVKRYLGEMHQMELFTREFAKFLAENNMFTPLAMRVRYAGQLRSVTGCYVVNEERLNNVSDTRFLELREKRYFAPIYAHLTSVAQLERLAMLKEGQTGLTPELSEGEERIVQ